MFKFLLGHNVFMLYSFNYESSSIWKPTIAMINSVNDEPERFATHDFHYFLDYATFIIDKAFTLDQAEGSEIEYDMTPFEIRAWNLN